MKTLENAAKITADLEKKVAENAENEVTVERTKKPETDKPETDKKTKVKLTDVIIKLIGDATYLKDEQKTQLLAAIDGVITKVTNNKPSLKNEIRELLVAAGDAGISRDGFFTALSATHPDVSPFDLSLSFYGIMQPVNYRKEGKFGWDVKVVTGGNYVWGK